MLAAVAVGMLESRAFDEISKERWKQIVVSCLSTFPAFPRALGQNLNPRSVNHVPDYADCKDCGALEAGGATLQHRGRSTTSIDQAVTVCPITGNEP